MIKSIKIKENLGKAKGSLIKSKNPNETLKCIFNIKYDEHTFLQHERRFSKINRSFKPFGWKYRNNKYIKNKNYNITPYNNAPPNKFIGEENMIFNNYDNCTNYKTSNFIKATNNTSNFKINYNSNYNPLINEINSINFRGQQKYNFNVPLVKELRIENEKCCLINNEVKTLFKETINKKGVSCSFSNENFSKENFSKENLEKTESVGKENKKEGENEIEKKTFETKIEKTETKILEGNENFLNEIKENFKNIKKVEDDDTTSESEILSSNDNISISDTNYSEEINSLINENENGSFDSFVSSEESESSYDSMFFVEGNENSLDD